MSNYKKLIAAIIGLIVTVGIVDSETAQAIGAVLTALAVYVVPNEPSGL